MSRAGAAAGGARSPLKVALVSLVYPHPKRGIFPGVERHILEYSRALTGRGAEVHVATTFWNGGGPKERHEGIQIHRLENSASRYGRLGRLFAWHVTSFARSLRALEPLFSECDIVQTFIPLPSAAPFGRARDRLVATFYHRDTPSRLMEYLTLPRLYALEKAWYASCPLVLTFSESSRRVLVEEYGVLPGSIEVTPLGVDMTRFHAPGEGGRTPRPAGSPLTLLFVGPLIKRKGLHDLLEALGQVKDRLPAFRLVLVGDGREKETLAARAAELGLADRMEFRGYVDGWGPELPEIYRQADLFVFPSHKEGFGMVLAEAMACGTPVVTTRVSAIPEVVADTGLLVAPSDPPDLARALLRIMDDEALRTRLALAGERRVRDLFSWDAVVDRTLAIFDRLIERRDAKGGAV